MGSKRSRNVVFWILAHRSAKSVVIQRNDTYQRQSAIKIDIFMKKALFREILKIAYSKAFVTALWLAYVTIVAGGPIHEQAFSW